MQEGQNEKGFFGSSHCYVCFWLMSCSSTFDGSRTGNDSEFIMDYKVLNTTDTQDLTVEAGDTIHAKIVIEGGQLSFKIQKDDDVPICESVNVSLSDEFDVKIEESGIYTVTVTGAKAKGSISFTVESSQ